MAAHVEPLPFHPPFDWEGLLSFFAPRAIPGVEAVQDGALRRTFSFGNETGFLELRQASGGEAMDLKVWGAADLTALARRVLDLDCEPSLIERHLKPDPTIGPLWSRWPGIRLPGAWDPFEMGVRAVLGQQVSVKAAHTLAGRLVTRYGHKLSTPFPNVDRVFPRADELAAIPATDLAGIGIPIKRAQTLRAFAAWSATPEASRRPLLDVPGIGPWTESYLRMRGSSDRDAFPAGDLGIHKALGLKELGPAKATKMAEARSDAWRPVRAYAVFLLWRSLS